MGQKPTGRALAFAQRVAAVIDDRRAALGMTKAALIQRSGMPANTFYTRIRGDRPFDLNDIEILAHALGCEPDVVLLDAAEGTALAARKGEIVAIRGRVGGSGEDEPSLGQRPTGRRTAAKRGPRKAEAAPSAE